MIRHVRYTRSAGAASKVRFDPGRNAGTAATSDADQLLRASLHVRAADDRSCELRVADARAVRAGANLGSTFDGPFRSRQSRAARGSPAGAAALALSQRLGHATVRAARVVGGTQGHGTAGKRRRAAR